MATFVVQYELKIVKCIDLTSWTISNDKYPYNDIEVKIDVSVHGGFPLLTQYHFIVTPNTSESFLRINDNFLVALLYVYFNRRTTFVPIIQQLIFNPEETRIIHHLIGHKTGCYSRCFIDRKMVIKYRMINPTNMDLYPSVKVNLEVLDNSDSSIPRIMNLSLGGWRIDCLRTFNDSDYNPHMLLEKTGNIFCNVYYTSGVDDGTIQPLQLGNLSSSEGVDKWILKFQFASDAKNCDDIGQSSIMPTFFKNDILVWYRLSEQWPTLVLKLPTPSQVRGGDEKLINGFIQTGLSYRVQYKFFVIQKIFNCFPNHVTTQAKFFGYDTRIDTFSIFASSFLHQTSRPLIRSSWTYVAALSLKLDIDIRKSQIQDPETREIIHNIMHLKHSSYQIVDDTVFHLEGNGAVPYIPSR
ncbi:hypothetical protein RF11_06377 [Thelohanellus kitauei]|uniref:Uncharacterized protein n=1 Tax=Thelohanellus kitauei TaxID=669202 RepID=A0A0C2J8I5_THEKT|nr:hypothetical protein RF11_06377 [Thelohanellus kitauei]